MALQLRFDGRDWFLVSRRENSGAAAAAPRPRDSLPLARRLLADHANAHAIRAVLGAERPWPLLHLAAAETVAAAFSQALAAGEYALVEKPRKMRKPGKAPEVQAAAEAEEWVEAAPAPAPEEKEEFDVPPHLAAVQAQCNKEAARNGAAFSAEYRG
jgi:hypothetical protein